MMPKAVNSACNIWRDTIGKASDGDMPSTTQIKKPVFVEQRDGSRPVGERERASLADRATQFLRDRILDLTLAPGQPLDEKPLLEEFGFGRTPMREALNRLMSEGLVETRETRGFIVAPMNLEHTVQLLDAYAMSERMVASRLNFEHPGLVERLQRIDDTFRHYTHAEDILNVTAVNADFHRVLANATDNVHIEQFSYHLHNLARRLSYFIYRAEKTASDGRARLFDKPLEDHRQIIDAIGAEDRERLLELMTHHGDLFRSRLSKIIEGTIRPNISFDPMT